MGMAFSNVEVWIQAALQNKQQEEEEEEEKAS